jgi:GNAT superfamily N-acetyltransferase
MPPEFRAEAPDIEQFWALFQTTGWNREYQASAEELARALRGSQHMVAAYEGERLVGFGRVVTDGVLHAMVYDLIVDPAWRGQGIGGQILECLVRICREASIRDIQLVCARGKRAFYEKRGFAARPEDAPGMQHKGQR